MKLGIVSDFHIGYERFFTDAYVQARDALELASSMCDALLIPGDVFDKRNPRPDVIAQAVNIFRDLKLHDWKATVTEFKSFRNSSSYTNLPIIAIPGTHERVAEGKENPVTVLALAGLLVDASESTVTIKKNNESVSIFGLGGLSEEMVKSTLARINPTPVDGNFNIFMFHQSTYELLPFSEHFIHNEELPEGFDLYIDGHIHSKFIGKIHGSDFLIPGSTVLTQQKENEQGQKGFFIYDTESKSFKFQGIKSRPFIVLNFNFDKADPGEVTSKIEPEIQRVIKENNEKPIIRVLIKGSIGKGFKNTDLQLRSLSMKFSGSAFLDIDYSKLVNSDIETEVQGIQEGKLEGLSIKELGMSIFNTKLKEAGFPNSFNISELFDALSIRKKEKALKEAMDVLENTSMPNSSP